MRTTSRHLPNTSDEAALGRARIRGRRPIATAALTVSLLAAVGAPAAAQWSAPTTVTSGSYQFCCRPSALAFTGDGHALATLRGSEGASVLAAAPGTSTFTQIGRAGIVDEPAVYGRRGVAYLRTARARQGATSTRLGVSLGRLPGTLGAFRALARIPGLDLTARIAADHRGNVAAAWLQPRPGHAAGSGQRVLVRLALRQPGHAFGPARTIGEATIFGDFTPLQLAYGAAGDLVVAFQRAQVREDVGQRDLRLVARIKRRGDGFGAAQMLGPLLGSSSLSISAAPTGRAVIAWGTQDAGEGVEQPWRVRAAVLHAGARRFSKTQLLDPGRVGRPVADVSAAISPRGIATVAWSGVAAGGQPYPVRVATAGNAGRFGPSQQLAPNGETMGLATAADGSTTVLWGPLPPGLYVEDDPYPDQVFASHRPARAGAFAAPEPVSPRLPAGIAGGRLAIDPRTARPAALWTSGPGADVQTALYSTPAG